MNPQIRIENVSEPRGKDWGRRVYYDEVLPDGRRTRRAVDNVMVDVSEDTSIRLSVLLRRRAKEANNEN